MTYARRPRLWSDRVTPVDRAPWYGTGTKQDPYHIAVEGIASAVALRDLAAAVRLRHREWYFQSGHTLCCVDRRGEIRPVSLTFSQELAWQWYSTMMEFHTFWQQAAHQKKGGET